MALESKSKQMINKNHKRPWVKNMRFNERKNPKLNPLNNFHKFLFEFFYKKPALQIFKSAINNILIDQQ